MAGAPAQREDEPITDINITPLVDVSLVLVIIFMAIAPYAIQAGLKVLESRATTAVGKVSASENVSIKLAKDGRLTINGTRVACGISRFRNTECGRYPLGLPEVWHPDRGVHQRKRQ